MSNESNTSPEPYVSDAIFEKGEFEWIEKAAVENLKQRLECADVLAKEAATTLTVLLAGIGGSLAFAIRLLDGDYSASVVASTAVCLWLTLLAIILVFTCLKIDAIYVTYNEPKNLLKRKEHKNSFDAWRTAELLGMQYRIEKNVERNDRTAKYLNRVRAMAAVTPAIAALGLLGR